MTKIGSLVLAATTFALAPLAITASQANVICERTRDCSAPPRLNAHMQFDGLSDLMSEAAEREPIATTLGLGLFAGVASEVNAICERTGDCTAPPTLNIFLQVDGPTFSRMEAASYESLR